MPSPSVPPARNTERIKGDLDRKQDDKKSVKMARLEFGEWLRNRRDSNGLASARVAERIGYKPPSYADIESGDSSSERLDLWFGIADALDLEPRVVIGRAWETRKKVGLNLRLPPETDFRRKILLDLAVEQAMEDDRQRRGL